MYTTCIASGLCLDCPGCDCEAKKKRHRSVDVIYGTNASSTEQFCTTVEIEEHRSCRCKCNVVKCHYNKIFDPAACLCRCNEEHAAAKAACVGDFDRFWDEETCSCRCKRRICVSQHYQDQTTCECRPPENVCTSSPVGSQVTAHTDPDAAAAAAAARAPKYIGLACVVAIALAMVLSLYYLIARRKTRDPGEGLLAAAGGSGIPVVAGNPHTGTETVVGTLQRASSSTLGGRQTAAYTITINSASTSNLDEAILPLTEDKTRF